MQNEKTLAFAREKLLSDVPFGKCDCIDQVIPKETLLTAKPRYIRELLANILSIEVAKIPLKSFYTWLSRYRIKNNNKAVDTASGFNTVNRTDIKDWRNFQPSTPVRKEEKPLLNFPYNNRNSSKI